VVTLWMGVGSTYITRRTAAASQTVIDDVNPQRVYEGAAPEIQEPATEVHAPAANAAAISPKLVKKISTERRGTR
jgi:hypothetical protein